MKRQAVTFENTNGQRLFGILEEPANARTDVAVVLLSPGVKMRVGPNQLYRAISRIFTDEGFCVLRFDFSGLGDSEGEIEERRLHKVYNSIVDGAYVGDTIAALDWLQRRTGCQKAIAAGLCGGAVTGLLAAQRDSRIKALFCLGIPVTFEGGEEDYWRYVTEGELKNMEGRYFRNLRRGKSWIRFLTFRSDYRIIFKMLTRFFKERLNPSPAPEQPAAPKKHSNLNPKFSPAFFAFIAEKRPMLLMFGSQDRWRAEFIEKFEQANQEKLSEYRDRYQFVTIPDANHILSSPDAQDQLKQTLQSWLTVEFNPSFKVN